MENDVDLNDDFAVCRDLLRQFGECQASTPKQAEEILASMPADDAARYMVAHDYETMMEKIILRPEAT